MYPESNIDISNVGYPESILDISNVGYPESILDISKLGTLPVTKDIYNQRDQLVWELRDLLDRERAFFIAGASGMALDKVIGLNVDATTAGSYTVVNASNLNAMAKAFVPQNDYSLLCNCQFDLHWYAGTKSAEEVEKGFKEKLYTTNAVIRIENHPSGKSYLCLSLQKAKLIKHYEILNYESPDRNDFDKISKRGYYHIRESPISNEFFLKLSDLVQTYSSPPRIITSWVFSELNLQIRNNIGNGSFGDVTFGVWQKSVKSSVSNRLETQYIDVIIKKARAINMTRVEFFNRAKLLATLSHPNIVTFYGIRTQKCLHLLIQEFLKNGYSLRNFLMADRRSLHILLKIIHEVAAGIEYLESRAIFYRNFTVLNVRVMEGVVCKITDYGQENVDLLRTDEKGNLMSAIQIVPWENDVIAFGIFMYDVFAFAAYPEGRFETILMNEPERSSLPDKPVLCPAKIYKIINLCWKFDTYKHRRPYFTYLKTLLNVNNIYEIP